MIIRKIKEISKRILKTSTGSRRLILQEEPPRNPCLVDTQPLPGIKYLQRRQMASNKQYFDSADHFLKLYEMETILETAAQNAQKDTAPTAQPDPVIEPTQAPLETAYSEIVDEMKPKESV